MVRALGFVFLLPAALLLSAAIFLWWVESPTQHIEFRSRSGTRVALLSHSDDRDSSATSVTLKGSGCCYVYTAYEYYGDGEDYIGAKSVKWIDDHHLAI